MKTKKITLPACLAALVALSGCGGKDAGTAPAAPADTAKPASKEPIELVFYYPFTIWNEQTFKDTFGDAIRSKFPNITPKLITAGKGTSIKELVTAGTQVDVMITSIGTAPTYLLDMNLQTDITPLIQSSKYDLTRLEPAAVEQLRLMAGGGLYGLPVYSSPATVYYNKDIFDKFGVAYPQKGMTWDEMYELSRKLTRSFDGVQYVGLASSFSHLAIMNQRSLPLLDKSGQRAAFETDAWKQFIGNIIRFYQVPGYEGLKASDYTEPNQRARFFKERRAAMYLAITGLLDAEAEGMNYDYATFPVFKDQTGSGPQIYPNYFFVTSTSKYKEQAFDAIAYLTSDEFQMKRSKEGKLLTVLRSEQIRSAFGQDNPVYKGKNVSALLPASYPPSVPATKYDSVVANQVMAAMQNMLTAGKDLNTALRDAAAEADKKIAEAEKK